jgi:hypothetical protein
MRTVLYGIHLLIDNSKVDTKGFYIKREERGREQGSGETQRARV